jgi:hypothetical protein
VGAFLGVIEGGAYSGRGGLARYFSEAEETWSELNVSGEEFRDLGDRVLVRGRMEGQYRGMRLWEAAVREAGSLDQGEVIEALDHAKVAVGPDEQTVPAAPLARV